ncbi:MAG TPA: amino acid adenylation domain-containing protein [Pyrinomonadaceae bacterium]|nr:amino acid adenylation domain-containing protein [Pyrinomonadaceae bacterium]
MQKEVVEGFQLSPQQKHLWSLCGDDRATVYRSQCGVRLGGRLDKRALREAVENVVRRHEILRTSFHRLPGMDVPLQIINEPAAVTIVETDLGGMDAPGQEAELEALFEQAGRRAADFDQEPLLHLSLIRLSPDSHVLLMSIPALCADAVGLRELARAVGRAYAACLDGEELLAEPVQYADLSEWQNELLISDDTQSAREFWRRQDLSALHLLALPGEKQLTGAAAFDPRYISFSPGHETAGKVAAVSGAHGVDAPVLLLACWQTLLWRLHGESDAVVCAAFDGRMFGELEEALGLFVKYLPVASRLETDLPFAEALRRADESMRDVSKWQECFSWELAGPSLEDAPESLFCPFSFDINVRPAKFTSAGIVFSVERSRACVERFKAKLSCVQGDEGLSFELHYDASLYEEGDVRRLASQYQKLLESVVDNPQARLTSLDVLGDAERRQLLIDFNDTKAAYPLDRCLHQLFEEQAARTPDAVAVVFEQGRMTYAELNGRANQLAHHLRRLGVGPEAPVGICVERSLEMVFGLLGILKAGAAYVPLDPSYPGERLSFMLDDSHVPVLLTQRRLLDLLPEHQARVLCLDDGGETFGEESRENPRSEVEPANLAYVIYTSGSTGTPKGVMVPHEAIANRLLWMQDAFPLTVEDTVLQKTPFSFDASVWEFFAPLIAGARLLVARPGGHQDNVYLTRTVAEQQVTTLQLVPSMYRVLLETEGVWACNVSLRRVFCGGETLPAALQERSFALLDAELHNLYGPTETAIDAASWKCRPGPLGVNVPIGRPIGNTQIYLLSEDMRPVPTGVAGEVYIGGVGVARGYLRRADLTAERFVPNPFGAEPGARFYKTGDLARHRPSGGIEFLGRIDDQVKLRGFRIELGEIEAVLRLHPALREAVVMASEETPGESRLVAYVVPEPASAPTVNELRDFLHEKLPDYMVPTSFVVLEALPMMPNGKVNRRGLPSAVEAQGKLDKIIALPRDNLEGQLVRIWKEVLGTKEHLGVTDNFFDLGGHSLLAVRLMAQIHKWFGQELPLSILFEGATIEHLADVLRGQAAAIAPTPIVPIQPKGSKPPFFCVHTGSGEVLCYEPWARYMGEDQPFYGVQDHFAYKAGDPEISIEEMAASYVGAVRAAQPEGPYLLGGWSFGGLVAFEMARQLREQGQDVPLLVVVDAGAPSFLRKAIQADDAVLLTILANEFVRYSLKDEELKGMLAELRQLDSEGQLRYVMKYFMQSDAAAAHVEPHYAFQFLQRHLRVFRTRVVVSGNYVPQVYPGRVTLFRSNEEPPEMVGLDPAKGWGELSTEPVEIHVVPGNHATMGLEPHVRVLAERLRSCIDEALSASRSH